MKRSLISLQGEGIVAALIDDLLGDGALAIERVGSHDVLQPQHLQQFRHGGNFVRLRVGGDLRQHKALLAAPGGDHVQRRLATGAVERAAQNLAVDRHNPFALLGETSHEPLKRRPELLRIEHAEKPAERVMAGNAILKPEKPAPERLLRLREKAHVDRALPAAQNRAHGYRENLMKVMQRRIASARLVQTVPAFDKAIQNILPRRENNRDPVKSISPETQNPANVAAEFQMREFPCIAPAANRPFQLRYISIPPPAPTSECATCWAGTRPSGSIIGMQAEQVHKGGQSYSFDRGRQRDPSGLFNA